jgi:exodeoxyribonuclease-5
MVGQLVEHLHHQGRRVVIAAPTNKAVAVLAAKVPVPVEAATVHSLLGLRLKDRGDGSTTLSADGIPTLGEYDVAIVDECSMVSRALLAAIFRARGACKILFVGDPAQLPPVDDGEESPVFLDIQHKVRLSEVVRQAADNPIIAMTMAIRRAIEEQRRVTLDEIAAVIPTGAKQVGILPGGAAAVLDIAVADLAAGADCRVVAYDNEQVVSYNQRIHAALHGFTPCEFAPGERVIAQTEFRALDRRRVFTSEELEFVKATPDGEAFGFPTLLATLRREDGSLIETRIPERAQAVEKHIRQQWREYHRLRRLEEAERDSEVRRKLSIEKSDIGRRNSALKNTLANLRHAYAITAHKSQGSTFHTVIVDWKSLSRMPSDFEFNRGLYVACTRAAEHMAIVT